MSSFEHLPQELFTDICTRLTIKTIVQISCVCKSLNALIKNPNFIAAHTNRTIAEPEKKTPLLLLRYHSHPEDKEHFSIHCDNETFDVRMTLDSSHIICSRGYYRIVGSCNGVICLCRDSLGITNVVVVWNPTIRKTFRVPMAPSLLSCPLHDSVVIGFGFDSLTDDFKIIRMVNFWDSEAKAYRVPELEVYEGRTGLWRGSSAVVPPYDLADVITPHDCSHVFLKGASHWVAFERGTEENRYLILSFDMASEVFGEMVLPGSVANGIGLQMSISVFGESLSVFEYDGFGGCCIWVMKEYGIAESWTKLFSFESYIRKVLGFRKNGEIVVEKSYRKLVSFDPKSKQDVDLGICGSKYKFSSHLDTYTESLVLLDGKDQGLLNP